MATLSKRQFTTRTRSTTMSTRSSKRLKRPKRRHNRKLKNRSGFQPGPATTTRRWQLFCTSPTGPDTLGSSDGSSCSQWALPFTPGWWSTPCGHSSKCSSVLETSAPGSWDQSEEHGLVHSSSPLRSSTQPFQFGTFWALGCWPIGPSGTTSTTPTTLFLVHSHQQCPNEHHKFKMNWWNEKTFKLILLKLQSYRLSIWKIGFIFLRFI